MREEKLIDIIIRIIYMDRLYLYIAKNGRKR